ncbi:MAG: NADH-quinone oxidoreductase subunit J [Planctomycetota bacterium]|nr:NADH-quinone oxidoreductase subunit J [Planctomycetota bacterium]
MTFAFLPDLSELIPELIFYGLAGVAVLSAIVAAVAPRIVHAAFGLMAAFFGVAGLYAMLGADFVAFSQIIVYVGGILVLLVFGVLLTARTEASLGIDKPVRRAGALAVGALVFVLLALSIDGTEFQIAEETPDPLPTTSEIGRAFLDPDRMLIAFEFSSVLLLAALIGAAYLARRRRSS